MKCFIHGILNTPLIAWTLTQQYDTKPWWHGKTGSQCSDISYFTYSTLIGTAVYAQFVVSPMEIRACARQRRINDRSRNLIYSWSFKTGITNNNNNNNDDTHNTRKHNNIEFKHARRPGGHGPGWSLHRGGMFRQRAPIADRPAGWTGSPDVIRSSYANPVCKWSFSNECKTSAGCRN